ncbi:MAG: hypothetical protein AAF840_15720, partial [Bacteroidota bacterium]
QPDLSVATTTPTVITTPAELHNELWVRIYPDDIHVHTLEKGLTREENTDGRRFWEAWWAATDNEDLEIGAWKALVLSYGTQRASYIANTLDPRTPRLARFNDTILSNKPETPTLKVITHLQAMLKVVEGITDDVDNISVLNTFQASLLRRRMTTLVRLLGEITATQHAFYLRVIAELRALEAKLLMLQSALRQARAVPGSQEEADLLHLQQAFNNYAKVQDLVGNIEVLDTSHYQARVKSRLRYPRVRLKADSWTEAPHVKTLPDRFAVVAYNDKTFEHIVVGQPIPKKLNVGLDPATFDFDSEDDNPFQLDGDGELKIDEGMKWMVDFNESVEKGMGVRIRLTQEQSERGFDRLLVVGVRNETARAAKQQLEDLLENHRFAPDGMSFLKVGTPTNNTNSAVAGYRSDMEDPALSYRTELGAPLFDQSETNPLAKADGKRLAEALGIGTNAVANIAGSANQEISRAHAIHKALWHVSFGDFMESSFDNVFTYDNIERTYKFMTENVAARGIVPTLRI